MQHGEREREMMIEVARLQRECNSLHSRLASETARADRNAKEVAETLDALSGATDRTVAAQEALAAARRECDVLRAMLRGCRPLVAKAHVEADEGAEEGWFDFLRRIDAALADGGET